MIDRDELRRWLGQAEHTLASARHDADARDWGWAAFKAQQAAEYALKALLRATGGLALGHSVLRLAEGLDLGGEDGLGRFARELDRHYIPPRCADAYPAGSPFEFYDAETADRALAASEAVVTWARERGAEMERDDA